MKNYITSFSNRTRVIATWMRVLLRTKGSGFLGARALPTLTLVDSQIAASVRRSRRWPAVYETIPRFTPYDGVSELLVELRDNDIGVCVVTSSPQSYCSRVLKHFDWKQIKTVCYHDTSRRKPDADPLLRRSAFVT